MSEVPLSWSEQRGVESFEVDKNGTLKPHMLLAYLLNAAWKHATLMSHGFEDLQGRNQMWVLTKFQAAVTRLPSWGEQVHIDTWGKGVEKLCAMRDFIVSSAEGGKLVSATSAWMILDKGGHRPLRIEKMNFPWNPNRQEMETKLEKVPELAHGVLSGSFRTVYSDIDVNQHVTATKYLQWVTDSHEPSFLQSMRPVSLEMSFLAEALIGDEVAVYLEQRDGRELSSVKRTADNKELCRAIITWASV
jgi:acyl-ACP thioesterase